MYCTKYYGMLFRILFYGCIGHIRALIEALASMLATGTAGPMVLDD